MMISRIIIAIAAMAASYDASAFVVTNWYRLRPPSGMTQRHTVLLDLHAVTNAQIAGSSVWFVADRLELRAIDAAPGVTNFFPVVWDSTNRVGIAITRAYVIDRCTPLGCQQSVEGGVDGGYRTKAGRLLLCRVCPCREPQVLFSDYYNYDRRDYRICIPKRGSWGNYISYNRPYWKRLDIPGVGTFQLAQVQDENDHVD